MYKQLEEKLNEISRDKYSKQLKELDKSELYGVIGELINEKCASHKKDEDEKRAAYFSVEYLIGKLLYSNLYNMKNIRQLQDVLEKNGHSLWELEDIDDYAFGNGGLGRLAACFLDSAASCEIPLDGYGIRYKYGLFRQDFSKDGEQTESPDAWEKIRDAFGIKRENESVRVDFADCSVRAVPYDYNIIGYGFKRINTLRLYEALGENEEAKKISEYLYPDDSTLEGKRLRLRQQYFFVSAALQNITGSLGTEEIENKIKIQLNDTHPVLAIPELINICIKQGISFDEAFEKCKRIFAYTNHTVMPEALEEWDTELMRELLPEIYGIIEKINEISLSEPGKDRDKCAVIYGGRVRMAYLACFVCSHINGVAPIHSEILKNSIFSGFYRQCPEKFINITNGITQRRWLGLCNTPLADFLSSLTGSDITEEIEKTALLEKFRNDKQVARELHNIKQYNKRHLCDYLKENYGISLCENSVFAVMVKRQHEYKRQLLAVLGAVHLYLEMKKGSYTHLPDVTFIFGGKAAPGYKLAKSIIKYINCTSRVINNDKAIGGRIKIIFIPDYNVSLAEKIIPAADISLQLSLAGTEASGTGNMKLMMNGAVTLGTYDGANIEICKRAGEDSNYIFGLREHQVRELKSSYDPERLYKENPCIRQAVDTLVSGKFGKRYEFEDIYDSLFNVKEPDRYMVLADFSEYINTLVRALEDSKKGESFIEKSLMNIAGCSYFSSDRAVKEYADNIWFVSRESASG